MRPAGGGRPAAGARPPRTPRPGRRRSAPDTRATAAALAAALSLAVPTAAVPQEAPATASDSGGAVSVDSAAALRAALERPPGSPPFDALDAVALPFRVVTFPIHLAVKGAGELGALVTGPGPTPVWVRAYRDARAWGLRPDVGSLGPRSGPAVELALVRFRPFFLETGFSWRESQSHRAGLRFGPAGGPPAVEAAFGFHRDAEPHFWGLGTDTREDAEADFLHDRTAVDVSARARPLPWLTLGGVGGWEDNRVQRGFDDSEPDLQDRFDTGDLFGAGERTEYLLVGARAEADFTRRRLFQRRGVRLAAGATRYVGVDGTDSDFHRVRARAAGFLPLNARQTLALAAGVETSDPASGRGVPFTHLAALGDGFGGRAYPDQRFRGRDLARATAEWRFMAWRELRDRQQLEGFVFFEEGVVAPDLGDVDSSAWRPSWGGGLRFEDREGLVAGVLVAAGEEGARVQVETEVAF